MGGKPVGGVSGPVGGPVGGVASANEKLLRNAFSAAENPVFPWRLPLCGELCYFSGIESSEPARLGLAGRFLPRPKSKIDRMFWRVRIGGFRTPNAGV